MKKPIIITDVTRMQKGCVCVAGYDNDGHCLRPVLPPPGIHENALYQRQQVIVFPFATVEYDFTHPTPQPPHTEDIRYNPASVRFLSKLDEKQRRILLDKTLFKNVSAIFEEPIDTDPGHYIMDGRGVRSLGTIRPQHILQVIYELSLDNKWDYRLKFTDGEQHTYRLKITDLGWRYYCDFHRANRRSPHDIANSLIHTLQSSDVYLRVGLARKWPKFPDRCYLQLTGIYTFPDYLEGKTFADFAPEDK